MAESVVDMEVISAGTGEGNSSSAAGPSSGRPRRSEIRPKRSEIKKWNAVALSAWDIDVDYCAICRSRMLDPCNGCQPKSASKTSQPSQASATSEGSALKCTSSILAKNGCQKLAKVIQVDIPCDEAQIADTETDLAETVADLVRRYSSRFEN